MANLLVPSIWAPRDRVSRITKPAVAVFFALWRIFKVVSYFLWLYQKDRLVMVAARLSELLSIHWKAHQGLDIS
jgi:hypothetical protein